MSPAFLLLYIPAMDIGTKIELRVDPNQRQEFYIEYKIGDGEWTKFGYPYYTSAGALANLMQLREQTKYGLNESLKVLLGISEKSE